MNITKSISNYHSYYKDNGLSASLKYAKMKIRSLAAKSDWGWKLFYESNPLVNAGSISDYERYKDTAWEDLKSIPQLNTRIFDVSQEAFQQYLEWAQYEKYSPYFEGQGSGNEKYRLEKLLEHFISLQLLEIGPNDIFIDVASNTSPFRDIVKRRYGIPSYSLDLNYSPGINGELIGCDAGNTCLESAFVSAMTLHCSFEHFANGADINFVKECSRILKPGGRVCIIPLYFLDKYCIRIDPCLEQDLTIGDTEGASIVFVKDYQVDYGRFYNTLSFATRIMKNLGDLKATVYKINGLEQIAASNLHAHFALLLEKPR